MADRDRQPPQDPRQPPQDLSSVPAFLRRSVGRRPGGPRGSNAPVPGAATLEAEAAPRPGHSLDPASLPIPISRRRLSFVAGGLVVALLLVAFGHQVSDAAAASDRAAQLRVTNAGLRNDLADLQSSMGRVQDDTFIGIEARRYGLGARHEVPFALAPDAPSLPPDAPGSAALRVGADAASRSPLDAWLDLLFGRAGRA